MSILSSTTIQWRVLRAKGKVLKFSQPFTIATMLRQLNIDPKFIGYDEQEERWLD